MPLLIEKDAPADRLIPDCFDFSNFVWICECSRDPCPTLDPFRRACPTADAVTQAGNLLAGSYYGKTAIKDIDF